MSKVYDDEFKKRIVRLHIEEGRTMKSITDEYKVSKSAISSWCSNFSKECRTTPAAKENYDYMIENRKLNQKLDELEKANRFLKKSSGILCKGNRLAEYRFIKDNWNEFGVWWLLNKFKICPNAYYNFLKNRKSDYHTKKQAVLEKYNKSIMKTMEYLDTG